MNSTNLNRCLAVIGVVALMTGCSASSQRLSQEKSEVDDQKNAQKRVIDDRTAELKQSIDVNLRRRIDQLDTEKNSPGADKTNIDTVKDNLKKDADLAKTNIDQQSKTCKLAVDRNVKNLKAELDSLAKAQKYE